MANFNTPYEIEREGQMEFFDNYGIPYNDDASILVDNTDGVYNGNIFEFKLTINNLNMTLFQAIKYLSKMRVKGESVPATILLIDLNATTVYIYKSEDYRADIHKIYTGAASKDNDGFVAGKYDQMLDYSDMVQSAQVKKILKGRKINPDEMYMPVDIDENCIVGWAERYYREKPNASKGDFLGDDTGTAVKVTGEIRDPRHFKGLINPYTGKSNEKFKYLMDCLNDRLSKKDLGAFYTPIPYAKKAAELVQMAVDRVPDGNDYIILDRCVDAETEYFNGTEWKKMPDYVDGEGVLTWYPDGHAAVEVPKRYINVPSDEPFYHYTSNTLDMCLSASHRVIYEVSHHVKGSPLREKTCKEVFEKWNADSNGFRGRIPLTFSLKEDVVIDENILRVAVMINADGSYREKLVTINGSCKNPNNPENLAHDIYEVRVYKPRKIERARMLLQNAGIDFCENDVAASKERANGLTGKSFLFRFPFNPKTFPSDWIYLSHELKEAFLDELMCWDGSVQTNENIPNRNGGVGTATSKRYSSSKKHDIDLVQMIAHSCDYSTRLREDKRGTSFNYQLSLRSNRFSKMTKEDNSPNVMKTGKFEQVYVDRKYCFETASSYLVLRRNGKMFVTGNCAGTGNLEAALIGLTDKNGDDLIEHCVVSTYEYYEYKVLQERIGDKVRDIIPPSEANVIYENGKVANADAMSEDFINNPIIRQYVDNPRCTIIMFENPPYRDQSQKNNKADTKNEAHTDKSYVRDMMSAENKYGLAVNDILNCFVYSAWKYYLRQKTDSYILFAPIKHWKRVGLSNKHVVKGFIFDRQFFHASSEAISCVYFENNDADEESIVLDAYAINETGTEYIESVTVKKSRHVMSELFDKRKMPTDTSDAICCNRDGTEAFRDCRFKPYYNDNIVGYLRAESFGFDANSLCLTRNGLYNGHGFYLRSDKYKEGLPLFAAKLFPFDAWYYKNIIDTTSDGGSSFTKDEQFLKSCLIYTCLSNQNKCLSFDGSDGRRYQNELCFDDSRTDIPLALTDLRKYVADKKTALNEDEQKLIDLWNQIMEEARKTANYNPEFNYGVYQITKELNTSQVVGTGKNKKTVYDYPVLNGYLDTLRTMLKVYYKSHITEKMFKYELLK